MIDDDVKELDPAECLVLLANAHLGRLAFVDKVGVLPMIVPVDYVLRDGSVTLRTDGDTSLAADVDGFPVAFEIDGLDEVRGFGWDVVVRGHAEQVTDPSPGTAGTSGRGSG